MNRISPSTWSIIALAALFQIGACEGKSTRHGGDDHSNAGAGVGADGGSMPGGRGGATATGGSSGGSGSSGGRGGTNVGGAAGAHAGESQGGESQGGQPTAGEGGADAGSGGSPENSPVVGRVVDFWFQPIAGVPVTVGTMVATTTAQGTFTLPSVASEYDVSLIVSWGGQQGSSYAWRFEGLTRRDPTLQVYRGGETRFGNFEIDARGVTLDASRTLFVTIAAPNGVTFLENVFSESGLMGEAGWEGLSTTQATVHGLVWEFDSNELPTVYRSYDVATIALDAATTSYPLVALNLADETLTSGSVSGTVTSSTNMQRANLAFARFAAGAAIRVVNDDPAPNSYAYAVPALPSSSITVAASEGNSYSTAFALAHRDGLAPDRSDVALTIPAPPTLTAPASNASGVDPSTRFSWSASAGPCVFHIEARDRAEGIYVVTNRRTLSLPTFEGFSLRPGETHTWRVERHGGATTVNSLTGPEGYLDPFSVSDDFPQGPRTGDGTFSISTLRVFTTAD